MAKHPKHACAKCKKPHAGKYAECRACRLKAAARAQGWQDWAEKKMASRSLATAKKTKNCLCCGNPFQSEGAHNRVCAFCKNTASWRSGNDTALLRAAPHMGGEL